MSSTSDCRDTDPSPPLAGDGVYGWAEKQNAKKSSSDLSQVISIQTDQSSNEHIEDEINRENLCALIALNVFLVAERGAITAYFVVFVLYFLQMFSWSSSDANATAQAFQGLLYFFAFIFSVLSDAWLGRLRTMQYGLVGYSVGYLLTILSSLPATWSYFPVTPGALSYTLFFAGFVFLGMSHATSRACMNAIMADQANTLKQASKKGAMIVERMFRYQAAAMNLGPIFTVIVVPYVRGYGEQKEYVADGHSIPSGTDGDVQMVGTSYYYSFAVCAGVYVLGMLAFFPYMKVYPTNKPDAQANSVLHTYGAVKTGFKNYFRWRRASRQSQKKSKNEDYEGGEKECHCTVNPSDTCTKSILDHVDEKYKVLVQDLRSIRHVVPLCLIFLGCYLLVFTQVNSAAVIQAEWMSRPSWFEPEHLMVVGCLLAVVIVPIQDALITYLKTSHGNTFKLKPQKRITLGFLSLAFSMLFEAVLQYFVYRQGTFDENGIFSSTVSVWYLCIYIALLSWGVILTSSSAFEYSYTVAPAYLKGTLNALVQLGFLFGAIISVALSPSVTPENLQYMFAGLCGVMVVCAVTHHIYFRKYDS
eukprot:Nk52_evm44s153 gene=Nk52_evmTU44s153